MPPRADSFDLGTLSLSSGEARSLQLHGRVDPLVLSGQSYRVEPSDVPLELSVSRMTGNGYSLRLRFELALAGPCMRCLEATSPPIKVEAREVDQPGGGDELDSPYVSEGVLDLRGWVRDALMLALPTQLLCRDECAGLCPVCGENLNTAAAGHWHEPTPDPRWAKLRELHLE